MYAHMICIKIFNMGPRHHSFPVYFRYNFFKVSWLYHVVCWILVSRPGIKLVLQGSLSISDLYLSL